ncbi:MAG: ankyrin repeat domain-containing protein, partial [Endozoicomonadaceae bacterium]|nr:ankyrin repeat domain-containing protein [Endozoicomonadaceae bacterium]
ETFKFSDTHRNSLASVLINCSERKNTQHIAEIYKQVIRKNHRKTRNSKSFDEDKNNHICKTINAFLSKHHMLPHSKLAPFVSDFSKCVDNSNSTITSNSVQNKSGNSISDFTKKVANIIFEHNVAEAFEAQCSNACEKKDIKRIKRLIIDGKVNSDMQVRADNNSSCPILIWATSKGYFDIACLLLNNKANINIQDAAGRTSLMHATLNGHSKILKLLIANGADQTIRDSNGYTALMLAHKCNNSDAINLLSK